MLGHGRSLNWGVLMGYCDQSIGLVVPLAAGRRRSRGGCGCLLLLLGLILQPRREVFLRAGVDDDRHEAVIASAELSALTAVETDLVGVDVEPGFVDESGDAVLLDAES